MRILISAFAISPHRGSESGLGWAIASRLAEHHEVTVLHGDVNGDDTERGEIKAWFDSHPHASRFAQEFVPASNNIRRIERIHRLPGLHFLFYAAYHQWQKLALEHARELHGREPFDLTFQLTIATYREPGYLWTLGCPFFWGPVSGRTNVPAPYAKMYPFQARVEMRMRNGLNNLTGVLNRRVSQAAKSATHIWCVTQEEEIFFRSFSTQTSRMLEVGTSGGADPKLRTRAPQETLHIVWSGMHIARKALPLFVRAIAVLERTAPIHAHILGSAPSERSTSAEASALASRLGIQDKITWHGSVPHPEALRIMASGHVFVHTSIAEATSTVILEALASGMPVVCHDLAGMSTAISDSCGIKIAAESPEKSVQGFANALSRLLEEPGLLESLSRGAMEQAVHLTWQKKVQEIEDTFALKTNPLRNFKQHPLVPTQHVPLTSAQPNPAGRPSSESGLP